MLLKRRRDTLVKVYHIIIARSAVNTELINLYWQVGEYISWGEKTVDELATSLKRNHPALKGFNQRVHSQKT